MRRALGAAAMVFALLAMVSIRVVWSSRGEWRAALSSTGAEEIVRLGHAARLYAPLNPYSARAFARLQAIGEAEPARALLAFRELRSACLATRSFYTPHRALLDEANLRLAALMAEAEHGDAAARAWHAERLARDEAPKIGWTLLALAGLFAWIGAALGLFLDGIGADGRLRRSRALAWAASVVVGLLLFFVGLWRA